MISLAVQGTLKSLLAPQFESINLWYLAYSYGPALSFLCDCQKDHRVDYIHCNTVEKNPVISDSSDSRDNIIEMLCILCSLGSEKEIGRAIKSTLRLEWELNQGQC